MTSKVIYLSAVALMAGGMALAQSSSQSSQPMDSQSGSSTASAPQTGEHSDAQGDIPAAKGNETQSGKASQADPSGERPGSRGTPQTPDAGRSPKGETPATGVQTEQKGQSEDNNARPGTEPPTNDSSTPPKNMSSSNANTNQVPSYTKPIDSAEGANSSSTPSQMGTESGTASPNKM